MSVVASWRLIEDVLRENANSVFRSLRKPASDAQIQRLQTKIPHKLPNDFVRSLKIHDGLKNSYLGQVRLFDYWALLPVRDIVGVWRMMTDLQEECGFAGGKADPRIKNDLHWRAGWMPFMDADGDKLIIDLDPATKGKAGQVLEWSNSGAFDTRVLADSFAD